MRQPPPHKHQGRIWVSDPDVHGSARWADAAHLRERGYGPAGRHLLGWLPSPSSAYGAVPITYGGDRHEMIVAPTRGGKGVSGSIPRLLEHPGSAIVLDIKDGELALITAAYRRHVLGQRVLIIDPEDVVASRLGFTPAGLNPMARIDLAGAHAFEEAMLIGQACVVPELSGETHWSAEAEAMIAGLVLHQAALGGTLRDVRADLNRNASEFAALLAEMQASPWPLVSAAGARIAGKAERELSGVLSTAQQSTHFLEGPNLAASLSGSSIDLAGTFEATTIYIVLPARRRRTARSWLRVLIATLIAAVTALPRRPSLPVMVLLEEMATLGRMAIIQEAVALMAGYGLQFVMVWQDFSQLRGLYQHAWETFIANAASVQCFGTADRFTAEYLSFVCGQTSLPQLSYESAEQRASLFGDPAYLRAGDAFAGRRLIMPDELMGLHPAVQLIKLAGARPAMAYRPVYYLDARFRRRSGAPLYAVHPHHAGRAIPRPLEFTKAGLDLGRVLARHLGVG